MKLKSLFSDKIFYKSLFTIAVPIMLQNLINALVNMADTIMIGRLGTVEIAAVGLGNQFFFLYNMILYGICSGASVFTAQFWGKKDIPGIQKNTGLCLVIALGTAAIFTLGAALFPSAIIGFYSKDPAVIRAGASYVRTLAPSFIPFAISFVFAIMLRSIEKVRLAMVSTIIALAVNVVLNYCFIFGKGPFPAMGVVGAAAATVISRTVELCILVISTYARKYCIAGSIRNLLAFNTAFVRRFIRIVFPVFLNEFFWVLGVTTQNLIFARTHTDAIAAFNITNTVAQLTWVIFIGLGNGAAVLIGKKIGAGEEDTARDYANRISAFSPLVAVGAAMILFPISRLLPFVFNVNPAVLATANIMFIVLCCVYPFRAFNMCVIIGVCRAGGDTIFCVIYEMIFMWGLAIPLAAAAAFIFNVPPWAIYLCLASEDTAKAFLGLWRLRSGKWLHNVT